MDNDHFRQFGTLNPYLQFLRQHLTVTHSHRHFCTLRPRLRFIYITSPPIGLKLEELKQDWIKNKKILFHHVGWCATFRGCNHFTFPVADILALHCNLIWEIISHLLFLRDVCSIYHYCFFKSHMILVWIGCSEVPIFTHLFAFGF